MIKTENVPEMAPAPEMPENAADLDAMLNGMSEDDMLGLRAAIDLRLPPVSLTDFNLEQETLRQFQQIRVLFTRLGRDNAVPANQKAQLANSCAAVLQQLTKMQGELYSSERLKRLEGALTKTLRAWPKEQVEQFFADYERIYTEGTR